MHKLSYKTLFIILFILLIGIVILVRFVFPSQKASAAWWNDSWNYRQAINISTHTAAESNVYIITTVNIGTTTKAQIDDGDFRFITQNGDLLPYYISSGAGTTNVTFHVQFTSFPSGAQTIYAYYGNPSAPNGFSASDFATQASNYTIGSLSAEEVGGGPIAYWKFDEGIGSTAYDSSSAKLNGTIATGTSAPTWTSEDQCISDKCLTLYGTNSWIDIGTSLNYLFTDQNFTIESWINPARLNGADVTNYEIFGNESYNNYGILFRLDIHGTPGALSFRTSQAGAVQFTYSNRITVANTWYHVAAVKNGSSVRIYINGIDSTSSAGNHINPTLSTTTAYISGGQSFNGKMDDIKIYPYARTADQIKLDYNSRGSKKGSSANLGVKSSTAPSLSSKLVAYYKFDEGQGTVGNNSVSGGSSLNAIFGAGNSAPTWTTGKINKGILFDGSNDYTDTTYTLPDEGTISMWYYAKTWYNYQSIFDNSVNGDDWETWIYSDGRLMARIESDLTAVYDLDNLNGPNNWYYITVSWKKTPIELNLYVNGIKRNSDTAGTWVVPGTHFYLGGGNAANTKANGIFDEVKIYNAILTDQEILQDYNQKSAVVFGSTNQTIGGTTTNLDYCIPGDTSACSPPIAELNFEENIGTTTYDTSSNNNFGVFGSGNSAPTWTVGKKNTGAGLNFDGKQFITVADSTSLKPTATITTEAWFKTTDKTLSQKIFSKTEGSGYNMAISESGSACGSNYLCFAIYINGGYRVAGYPVSNLSDNTWYHVAGLYDGSTVKLFLNGSNVGTTTTITNTITQGAYNLCIGSETNAGNCATAGNFFSGKIDGVRIYDYARTPTQIAYDYNKGGPIGWWKLDECQGLTAFDSSGLGNTGTIVIGGNPVGTCNIGGTTAWGAGINGKINSSLNLDGTGDYINCGNSTIFDFTDAMTISAWIKLNNLNQFHGIAGKTADIWTDVTYSARINSSNQYSFVTDGGTGNNDLTGGSADLNWHHVVYWFSKPTKRIYVDGVQIAETSWNQSIKTNTQNLAIGAYTWGAGLDYLMNGKMDDVRIYNYALTPDQIKTVYNNGAVNFN